MVVQFVLKDHQRHMRVLCRVVHGFPVPLTLMAESMHHFHQRDVGEAFPNGLRLALELFRLLIHSHEHLPELGVQLLQSYLLPLCLFETSLRLARDALRHLHALGCARFHRLAPAGLFERQQRLVAQRLNLFFHLLQGGLDHPIAILLPASSCEQLETRRRRDTRAVDFERHRPHDRPVEPPDVLMLRPASLHPAFQPQRLHRFAVLVLKLA